MPIYLKLTVHPGSKKESVIESSSGRLEVCVKQAAAGGAANDRIMAIIQARYPGKPVRIVTGHLSRRKLVSIGL